MATPWRDRSLHCEEEKDNEYDKHAVAIIYDSFHSNNVVVHVPLIKVKWLKIFVISETFVLFLLANK